MNKTVTLPNDFFLGAAASAWQTEGWIGKRETQDSYIDLWYKENKEVWHNGYGPTVATNYYERYLEDIDNMKTIGLDCYRTSLNWSRFLVDYENIVIDETYASYFDKMLDAMIASGVEPMICLEHYEIPGPLFKEYDGFGSKHVVDLFVKYAEAAFQRFGHKVKYWFAFNEPVVVQTRIHLDALRYPFYQDSKAWMQWNYNKALATNMIMKIYQEKYRISGGKFGTIINVETAYPRGNAKGDLEAARMYDLFYNRVFLDPAIKGEYEEGFFELLEKHDIAVEYTMEELQIIKENTVDWVGINLYHPNRVKQRTIAVAKDAPFHPDFYYENFDMPGKKMNPHRGWEIGPQIMYDMAIRMRDEYHNIEWFIAENGMGVENEKQYQDNTGVIQDTYRIDFIKMHLDWLQRGIAEGSNCKGYMLWAFTDNVSPMNAFKNRYGLVSIDLENNRNRSLKKSAYFYQELIKTKKFTIVDEENIYK